MRMRKLGGSGLFVSELCFGAMTFGGSDGLWGQVGKLGQEDADVLVKAALDAGINLFDTANVYANGRSEEILGRMGLDHIDLYQIHAFDPATPIEETLEALDTLVRAGDVRYVGLSNWAAWQIMKAIGIARARNLAPITSLQAYYTLVGRELEREIGPLLASEHVGLMVWSPLAGGYLTGKYSAGGDAADGRQVTLDFPPINRVRGEPLISVLKAVAEKHGRSPAQIAIAWLLKQQIVSTVIVGAKRVTQLQENVQSVSIELDGQDMAELDAVTRLPVEYPGWLLNASDNRS